MSYYIECHTIHLKMLKYNIGEVPERQVIEDHLGPVHDGL